MKPNNRLKHFRAMANLSQWKLQKLCGWGNHNARISHFETGRVQLKVADAKVIIQQLKRLGVDVTLEQMFDVCETTKKAIEQNRCEFCGQEMQRKAS